MKIILLNAPPRAGKDTAANAIISGFENIAASGEKQPYVATHHKMADTLKKAAHALFAIDRTDEWMEEHKDTPLPELMNKSPRQVYIDLSEKFVKPTYGAHAFGWMFVNRLRASEQLADAATGKEYLCICSDLGFLDELKPLIAAFGAENILIMQITRDGCNFANDSRSYIEHPEVRVKHIINKGSLSQLQLTSIKAAHDWLQEKADEHDANPRTAA